MDRYRFVFFALLLLVLTGCSRNEAVKTSAYKTSFDSLNDTAGWIGISPIMFFSGEGKDYVAFKNNASRPAASMEVNILEEGNYKLLCTGKSNLNGGYVCLKKSPSSNSEARCIYINSNNWKDYSSSIIYCPGNTKVFIEVFAGGDVPSDLYLDEISLSK